MEKGLNDRRVQSGNALTRLTLGIGLLLFGAILDIWYLTTDDVRGETVPDEGTDTVVTEPESSTPR